jgi:CHAT domain-containing protein
MICLCEQNCARVIAQGPIGGGLKKRVLKPETTNPPGATAPANNSNMPGTPPDQTPVVEKLDYANPGDITMVPAVLFKLRDQAFKDYHAAVAEKNETLRCQIVEAVTQIDRNLYRGASTTPGVLPERVNFYYDQFLTTTNTIVPIYFTHKDFDKLLALRREIAAVHVKRYGSEHWKTIDANLLLRNQESIAKFNAEQMKLYERLIPIMAELTAENKKGNMQEVLKLNKESLEIYRQLFTEKNSEYATTLNNIAWTEQALGQRKQAEANYLKALELRKELMGDNHPHCGVVLNNLANHYLSESNYVKAKEYSQQGLELKKKTVGEQSLEYATSLYTIASIYKAQGNYAQAIATCLESMDIRSKLQGENHLDYVSDLSLLGDIYRVSGDNATALQKYEKVLEIRKVILGDKHPTYAVALNSIAISYQNQLDYTRAEEYYKKYLEITRNTLGEENPNYGMGLSNLSTLYYGSGDYKKAIELAQQALEQRKKIFGEQHPDYAGELGRVANLYFSMGDYQKSEQLMLEVLAIQKKVYGEHSLEYATSISSLAGTYRTLGDSQKNEQLIREAYAIRKDILGENNYLCAYDLNSLALLYHERGSYAEAEPYYLKAMEIRKNTVGDHSLAYAASLDNISMFYLAIRNIPEAVRRCQQGMDIRREILGENHPDYATSLNTMAEIYQNKGDYNLAIPLLDKALTIRQQKLGDNHTNTARTMIALAGCYRQDGRLADADFLFKQALEIRKKVLGEKHRDYALCLEASGFNHTKMGEYDLAENEFQQAIEIYKAALSDKHPTYATGLKSLSVIKIFKGDYESCAKHMKDALEITIQLLDQTSSILTEQQQLTMSKANVSYMNGYLTSLVKLPQHDAEAYAAVLHWKGATMVRQRAIRLVAEQPELAALFTQLQNVTRRWAALATAQTPPEDQDAWKELLTDLTAQKEKLEAELSNKSAEFRNANKVVGITELKQALPEKTCLIDFFEFNDNVPDENKVGVLNKTRKLLAFVVTPDHDPIMINLGPVAPISDLIDTWRTTYGTSAEGKTAGMALRNLLWVPLLPHLANAESILISPDGTLGRLPFAALPGQEPGRFLLEDHKLALVPVPQLIPALINEQGKKQLAKDLLLMGGVDYDNREDESTQSDVPKKKSRFRGADDVALRSVTAGRMWQFLPGTEGEIAFIKQLYTEDLSISPDLVQSFSHGRATEEAFRKYAPQAYVLHLATHGFFAAPDMQSVNKTESMTPAGTLPVTDATTTSDAPATTTPTETIPTAEKSGERSSLFGNQREMVKGFSPGLLSGIVFAGANQPPAMSDDITKAPLDDGYLTADEIASLPLNGVRLVVLSACETGLGEVAGGEGLLGIQRGFQISGVKSTIASYWSVDDNVTRKMMEEFYRNYFKKEMSTIDALREAQLWVLHHPDEFRGDKRLGRKTEKSDAAPEPLSPQLWAPFVLSGDWR